MFQEAAGSEADRFLTSFCKGGSVRNEGRFIMKIADGGGVVSSPGVPHRSGEMEEITGVNGGCGEVEPDCGKVLFIPLSCNGLGKSDGGCPKQDNQ